MQLTITLPDILPKERVLQFLERMEDILAKEGIAAEINRNC
jgi:hypothetical protein